MLSESRYMRRANKSAYTRITCPNCDGGYRHRGRPFPMACDDCERTGYVYISSADALEAGA